MRLPLIVLPLIALAGCTGESTARNAAPATPAPTTAAPSTPSTPAASAPSTPAPVAAAAAAAPAPAPKPAPTPANVNLQSYAGPTDNAELFGYDDSNSRLFFYSGGTITTTVKLTGDGDYDIVISAACDEANGEKAKFSVTIDGNAVGGEVTTTTTDAKEYVVKATGLTAGEHKIGIAFLNDVYKENEYDLNLYVHGITLTPAK